MKFLKWPVLPKFVESFSNETQLLWVSLELFSLAELHKNSQYWQYYIKNVHNSKIHLSVCYIKYRWTNEHPTAAVGGHDTSKPTVLPKIEQVVTLNRPTSSFCKVLLKRNLCHKYLVKNHWSKRLYKQNYICACLCM